MLEAEAEMGGHESCTRTLSSQNVIIIITVIIPLNCKWVFIRWQWYYNKTEYTNTQITQNNTPRSNKTQHTNNVELSTIT
jgi:hypothetical protein